MFPKHLSAREQNRQANRWVRYLKESLATLNDAAPGRLHAAAHIPRRPGPVDHLRCLPCQRAIAIATAGIVTAAGTRRPALPVVT